MSMQRMKTLFLATAKRALAIGFIAGLGMGFLARFSYGDYLQFSLVLSLLASPFALVYSLFAEGGPSGDWPAWRGMLRTTDGRGFPVVRWREGSILFPPRELFVEQNQNGSLHLVFHRPALFGKGRGMVALGGLIVIIGPLLAVIALFFPSVFRNAGKESTEREPWADLATIEVVPWSNRHGDPGMMEDRKRKKSQVIVAHFSSGRTIELSDWFWNGSALGKLRGMIDSAFIEERQALVAKAAAEERRARSAEAGPRMKEI